MESFIRQRSPNPGEEVMGLQNFGYVLFPDSETELEIPYVNRRFKLGSENNTKFGLTPEQQQKFENHFGVEFDSEQGMEFLNGHKIKISHLTNPIDFKNIEHEFNMSILKANGGMGLVNFGDDEEARRYPFTLVNKERELEDTYSRKKTRNTAVAELNNLEVKNKKRMVKVTKYIFDLNADYNEQEAYNKLDEFISGSNKNCEIFLQTLKLDEEWVDTMVLVKDCINYGFIRKAEDQNFVNFASGVKLGRTLEEITKFLMNPQNQDQIGTGGKNDQPYSLMTQLKNKIN